MARIKALSDSGMRITEIDSMLEQSEPLPPTEPATEPQEAPTTALTTFTALLDTLQAQQVTQQQIAALNERVTRLERAAHKHTGMVKGTPID